VDDYFFEETQLRGAASATDEKEDALRVTVKPHAAEPFEVLTYVFDDVKPDSAWQRCAGRSWRLPFRIFRGRKGRGAEERQE